MLIRHMRMPPLNQATALKMIMTSVPIAYRELSPRSRSEARPYRYRTSGMAPPARISLVVFSLLLSLLLAPHLATAQVPPQIDAEKDSLYAALKGTENGHLAIHSNEYLPSSGPMPEGDSDISAEIWAAWDVNYLYVYAEIIDDSVLVNKPNRPSNDCLELKFDPDLSVKSWAGILNVRLSALDTSEAESVEGVDNLYPDPFGSGVLPPEASSRSNYARRRTRDGYALELRLAWQWFAVDGKKARPQIGTTLGVAISIHDNDGGAPSPVMRDGSIQWSAGQADEVWLVPQLLGTMQLLGQNRVRFVRTNSIDPTAAPGTTYLSSLRFSNHPRGVIEFENWKYHPGDSLQWADPEWDDSSWEIAWSGLIPPRMPRERWDRIGWFRIRLVVDSSLRSTVMGIRMFHHGASEVYLDGRLLYKFGKVGLSRDQEQRELVLDPHYMTFAEGGVHSLAVRYSNNRSDYFLTTPGDMAGFRMVLVGDYDKMVADRVDTVRLASVYQGLFVFIPALLALFHFLLYLFVRQGKENLYFALSMLSWSFIAFRDLSSVLLTNIDQRILIAHSMGVVIPAAMLFGVITFYLAFLDRLPRLFVAYLIAGISIGVWSMLDPTNRTMGISIYVFIGLCMLEMLRVAFITGAEVRRQRWVMGAGFVVLMLSVAYQILMSYGILPAPFGIGVVYMWGLLVLSIAVSVDLSRTFARTNKELIAQLANVRKLSVRALDQERRAHEEEVARRVIEVDNARKTQELQEARKIQLSMLPDTLPCVPSLDIAVYTQPATEVGGDYYDFHQSEDGTLTIAVGDATGHGMKAGTMVATIKGMFSAQKNGLQILPFFQHCSTTIRTMHLGNLYMAMMLASFRGRTLTVSSAGMPPTLVYRARTGLVERIALRGMPLGATADFPYVEKQTTLDIGDTVLLMSDGLAELFNTSNETYDYPTVTETFRRIGSRPAKDIISALTREGEIWRGEKPQNDDITFVVVKVLGEAP